MVALLLLNACEGVSVADPEGSPWDQIEERAQTPATSVEQEQQPIYDHSDPVESLGEGEGPLADPEPGTFGAECETNDDCDFGLCVPSRNGYVCTQNCIDDCPGFWECALLAGPGEDPMLICVDRTINLCRPCNAHADCASEQLGVGQDDRCLEFGDEVGAFCGLSCASDSSCPPGYLCEKTEDNTPSEGQCVPEAGLCGCSWWASSQQATTSCLRGTCEGQRSCEAGTLSICSAPEPAAESCNGVDDDCDSVIDENFRDGEGRWTLDSHCGGCGENCPSIVEHGVGVCQESPTPHCVAQSCDPGYLPVGENQCVLVPDIACAPCSGDSSCFGGSCAAVDDQQVCLMPCAEDASCPANYQCEPLDGGVHRCVPTSGSCSCAPENAGHSRICFSENEIGLCQGSQNCDPQTGWSPCSATEPSEEVCNGVDDNCDGAVDEEGATGCSLYFQDLDEDGFGSLEQAPRCLCAPDLLARFTATEASDCDDIAPQSHPGALELCDEIDNNCNEQIDEGVQSPCGGCDPVCQYVLGMGGQEPFSPAGLSGLSVGGDGALQLDSTNLETLMLWVANASDNTISKINTDTAKEVARYEVCANPSRTAVDKDGNCWAGCRGDGRVAKIVHLKADCIDKNANGVIDTSQDANGDGTIDASEMVVDDECVVFTANTGGSNARAVGVDAENHAWVGLWSQKKLVRLHPTTGAIVQTINLGTSPYGLAIDAQGIIWTSARSAGSIGRADPTTGNVHHFSPPDCISPYGIAVAPNGHVWVANHGCGGPNVWRFNPQTLAWSKAVTDSTPRGLAAGVDGFIYVANDSASRVAKVDPQTMQTVAYANLGDGRGTMGIGIDAQGFVWAVNSSSASGVGTASKINPANMSVVAEPYVGSGPYSYSDMTGYALKTVVAPEGTYSHTFTGWTNDETRWLHVSVSTVTNNGGKVELRYRVADTLGALQGTPWAVASGSIPDTTSIFNLDNGAPVVGRHLQVEVKLVSSSGVSPRVQTLAVVSALIP